MAQRKNPNSIGVRLNRAVLSFSRHWLRYALVLLGLYVGLAFTAPTLMRLGLEAPARVLYTLYSPFCHQFAFRSMFLYGEQPFYPRYNTGSGFVPFETYAQNLPEFASDRVINVLGALVPVGDIYSFSTGYQFAAREFLGNEQMGYKVTLCARDISIYSAMLVGGILYGFVRKRLRPCPLYLYAILGLAPIGIDGFSQLFGYPPLNLWPPRETLPVFRVLTGAIFGLMNVWLAFPYFELSMKEQRLALEAKFKRAGIPF